MNNREKLELMDKVMRELADLKNSQIALINKAAKLQVDNMELNDQELDEKLGEVHEKLSDCLDTITEVEIRFEERRNKFEDDHGLSTGGEE
ncbi:MAG TPA: hypothetical protein VD772_04515 [Anseongella sp.]|nr:hypothetical protein [Anseongella sp.]